MGAYATAGWHWPSFLCGPFWYIAKGMTGKGVLLLILCVVTLFLAVPFVMIYCGARGKGDYYDYGLKQQSRIDLKRI